MVTLLLLAGCAQTPQQKYARFLQRGKRYLEKSDSPRATLEFRNAIKQQPKDADGYYWLAEAFLSENKVPDAVVALRRATELKPAHAAAQLKLAELMIRSRDEQMLKEAELRIQKILTGSPADEDALFTLAAAQAQLGKTGDAEKYLSDVVKQVSIQPAIANGSCATKGLRERSGWCGTGAQGGHPAGPRVR